ncbi:hypothetical protein [Pseudomonas sp. GL-R-19]|jgi:hypothetical protein|uniref:hypothetical protein n=1 Tax=Pseudomonas sp. GL-R-19 TaxID=2832391 RepID=UPI000E38E241|nr:hypothetical protein [Pseudomonas sp. GL-R-19]
MNAPLSSVYTNKASPDSLRSKKDYLFSQQLEGANKDVLRIIEQQRAYANAPPPTANQCSLSRFTTTNMIMGLYI